MLTSKDMPKKERNTLASKIAEGISEVEASINARAKWDALLADSEDVLELLLDETKAFRADRKAKKASRREK